VCAVEGAEPNREPAQGQKGGRGTGDGGRPEHADTKSNTKLDQRNMTQTPSILGFW
jgi:hypothetical protein